MAYLLDTDHVTLMQSRSFKASALMRRLDVVPKDDVATSIVSFQEQMQGWLAYLNQANEASKVLHAFARLDEMRRSFEKLNVVLFDEAAEAMYETLRRKCRTIGTSDLRIASIALTTDSILLTRNFADFARVPGLRFEDWTQP